MGVTIVKLGAYKINCISSAKESIILEVPQNTPSYMFSVALGNNGISIIIFVKAPASEFTFRGTWY